MKNIPMLSKGWRKIPTFFGNRLSFFEQMAQECGEIGSFSLGPLKFVLLSTPELIRAALLDHDQDFEKGDLQTNVFKPVVGLGLSTAEGEYHAKQRKLLAPIFQLRQLPAYAETVVRYTEQVQWNDGEVITLGDALAKLTMGIIGSLLFGVDDFGISQFGQDILLGEEYIDSITKSIVPIPLSWPLPKNQKTKKALHNMDAVLSELIAKKRKQNETSKPDLLTALIQAKYPDGSAMSDKQIRDEAVTAFLASYDNIGSTLTWAIYLLAQNPECYDRLCKESNELLTGRSATYADLANLPYATQVFKETLRLYPSGPLLPRLASRTFELEGYRIDKGVFVVYSPWVMHRQAKYFSDPQRFDPRRFAGQNEKQIQRYTYIPFGGGGSRVCPGSHIATMQGPLILAVLAKKWRFALLPGQTIVPKPRTALRPEPAIKVRVAAIQD